MGLMLAGANLWTSSPKHCNDSKGEIATKDSNNATTFVKSKRDRNQRDRQDIKSEKDVFHDDVLISDLDANRLKKYLQENFLVSRMGAPDKHRSQLLKKKYSG
jgi:hypothetical protein